MHINEALRHTTRNQFSSLQLEMTQITIPQNQDQTQSLTHNESSNKKESSPTIVTDPMDIFEPRRDFQQYDILTSVDADEPL